MDRTLKKAIKIITYKPAERLEKLRALPLAKRSAVFQELSPHVQHVLLSKLRIGEIVDIVDHMDLRQAETVLTRIKDEKRRQNIIKRVKTDIKDKIDYFLRFHPKATMSLVSVNYVQLTTRTTVAEAADAIDNHYQDTGKFPEVLVQENGELLGEVPMSVLVKQRNGSTLKRFVQEVQTITYQAEVVEIIELLTTSKRKKIVVLDNDKSVLGVIYADDALALFGNLPAESLYDVSGVDEAEKPFDSVWRKFTSRNKWLVLNLATSFMAGSMILLYKDTLDALVILAVYIPIVAGMGGNAASQTFAVMLRGITLGTVSLRNGMPVIWKEIGAGLLNGLVIGLIVAFISVVWNHNPILGVVVGLSMVGAHVIAGFFGAFVPLLLKHLGKDPAATSTIFITSATDVIGLFILLGLGSWLML